MCTQGKIMRLCTCDGSIVDQSNKWELCSGRYRRRFVVGSYRGNMVDERGPSTLVILVKLLTLPLRPLLYLLIWLLEFITQKPVLLVVARFISEKHNLLYQLNNFDVFDFEYEPVNTDTLSITVNDKYYHFEFRRGGWVFAKRDAWSLLEQPHVAQGVVVKK